MGRLMSFVAYPDGPKSARRFVAIAGAFVCAVGGCGVHAGNPTSKKTPDAGNGGGGGGGGTTPGENKPVRDSLGMPLVALRVTFSGRAAVGSLKLAPKEIVLEGTEDHNGGGERRELRLVPETAAWDVSADEGSVSFVGAKSAEVPFREFSGVRFSFASAEYAPKTGSASPLAISGDFRAAAYDVAGTRLTGFSLLPGDVNHFEVDVDLTKALVALDAASRAAIVPAPSVDSKHALKGEVPFSSVPGE